MSMKTRYILAPALFFLIGGRAAISGQSLASPESVFTYLTREEGAMVQLELNLDSLVQNRKSAQYVPATITDQFGGSFPAKVRTRGKFRRKNCEIPPIKIKFGNSNLEAVQMDTLNEIKLVLPCSGKHAAEELIVREYVAYRMFESLSPAYARARLISLQLKDTEKKRPQKMLAMLVEHEEEVTKRLCSSAIQEWGMKPERMDQQQVALMAMFQFMIGNTDWDISACRNVLLMQSDTAAKVLAIPFDFDFSGLVNAPYATPSSTSGLHTVQDRFLMAEGLDPVALQQARKTLLNSRGVLYQWLDCEHLSKSSAKEMRAFLDTFFDTLAASEEIPPVIKFSVK